MQKSKGKKCAAGLDMPADIDCVKVTFNIQLSLQHYRVNPVGCIPRSFSE